MSEAFQDQGSVLHCFGCGADNPKGLKLKSFWDGEESVATFIPEPYHCSGAQDIVYGGLIASLIDCHSCNFAIARYFRLEDRPIGSAPRIRCVTAQLNVTFLHPTPIGKELNLRAKLKSADGRKSWVRCEVTCDGKVTAAGDVLAIRIED